MKINIKEAPKMTIEELADTYNLEMEVVERGDYGRHIPRYWASFPYAEVKDGVCLLSPVGSGNTVEEAIESYAKNIQFKLLVLHAMDPDRRKEIYVPRLIIKEDKCT